MGPMPAPLNMNTDPKPHGDWSSQLPPQPLLLLPLTAFALGRSPTAPRRRISHHCSNALPLPRSPPLPDHGQQQSLITSQRNPLVKQLRQLHTTWGQREAGGVLLEGTHLLEEALRHGLALQRLVFTRRWAENHPALLAQVPPWFHQLVRAGRDGFRPWTPGDSQPPGPACLPDP